MKISLSARLAACCAMIRPGDRVADVGCDHGYLGIFLLTQGISPQVYASDINPGPLNSAARNARKYGVASGMRFFLSNGVQSVPRDFDVLVCAGMGADVMISILESAPWLRDKSYRLVLQCQSKTETLREYLTAQGWRISQETVFRDGRFLYTVMECLWEACPPLSLGEYYISPALLKSGDPALMEYLAKQITRLERAVAGKGSAVDPQIPAALKELREMEGKLSCKP